MTSTYKQAGELLDAVRGFHRELADFYRQLSDRAAKDRVRVLLDYMSRHEENFEAALADYDDQSARALLKTFMQFAPDPAILAIPDVEHIDSGMTVDDVIDLAMNLDERLVRFYSEAADLSQVEDLRVLFGKLKQRENARKAALSQIAADIKQQM